MKIGYYDYALDSSLYEWIKKQLSEGATKAEIRKELNQVITFNFRQVEMEKNKIETEKNRADPDCDACHGSGKVNVGSICTGFGGKPEYIECMCVLYNKIGMKNK